MADGSALFRDLAHATISHWKKKPTDNITQHNALFRWMKENGGIKDDIDGGLDLTEPVVLLENPTIQNYSGYQALNTGASALHLGRSLAGGERASFRLMALAIYSTALSDAALAQVQAHARAAHGF